MKKIEILGSGCPKCRKLEAMARDAVAKHGLEAEVTHVYDMAKILEYGIMLTPALVVDGELKTSGKLPSEAELLKALGYTAES